MKKTYNINIAGFPFIIDDDAYTLLNDYLDTISHAFKHLDESDDLVNDIESRVAELLLEMTADGQTIVTKKCVEDVIKRVGKPEEMVEEEETITIEEPPRYTDETDNSNSTDNNKYSYHDHQQVPPYYGQTNNGDAPKAKKKLYRDPQNSMLGGVCSGLGWYFGIDPTWIRLAFVLLLFASYATVTIAYIILWIILPEARTPYQRMQMMGKAPSIENIGETVTENYKNDNYSDISNRSTATNTISNIFSFAVKAVVIFGLCIAIPLLVAMGIGIIAAIFLIIMVSTSSLSGLLPYWISEADSTILYYSIFLGIGAIIALGIPIYLLVRMGLNSKPFTKNAKWALTIVWILGFVAAGIFTGLVIGENNKKEYISNQKRIQDREMKRMSRIVEELENNEIQDITIEEDSISISTDSSATNKI